jgi:hypothetical protein
LPSVTSIRGAGGELLLEEGLAAATSSGSGLRLLGGRHLMTLQM